MPGGEGQITHGAMVTVGAPRAGRRTWALFLLFAGFYLLTASGHLYTVDEETLYRVTESLVERHTFALPPDAWGVVASEQEAGGQVYGQYEPGQSLLAVPLYLLGRAVAPLFPPDARAYVTRFFVAWLGSIVTAATVALLYRLAGALGYRDGAALGLAAIYGLATTAWPFARTFFAEPLTALFLLLAFYALRRGTADDGVAHGWLVPSGIAAMAAVGTKPHAALALPILALYLLGRAAGPHLTSSGRVGGAALAWGVGLALMAVPLLAFNAAIYGGPLRTGYSASRLTHQAFPFLTGLYGMTISSGKGLLWYSPPLLLALIAARPFYRRHRAEALTCLLVVLVHLAFYSRLTLWNGDWAWGPRYLMIMLPFAILPLVAVLEGLRARRALAALVWGVVTLGVAVQLLGTLVNFVWDRGRIYDDPQASSLEVARYFSPPASPILTHARILAMRWGEWRARALPPPDTALLTGGFATTEGDPARSLFPRWTTGAGEIALHSAAREPLLVKLTFFDHRPPATIRERAAVLINGAPPAEGAVERHDFSGTGEGWVYHFTVPAAALRRGRASVTVVSATWNPGALGRGDRDEALGVYVHNVEIWRAGQPWGVREGPTLIAARAIEPLPPTPRRLYWWFNDDRAFERVSDQAPVHHLVDHWAWYAAVGGLGSDRAVAWIGAYATFAGGVLIVGVGLFLRSLPAGTLRRASWRHGRRRQRWPARARRLGSQSRRPLS